MISSLTPVTTAVPLIGVLALSAVKDAYDDIVSVIIVSRNFLVEKIFLFVKIFRENMTTQIHFFLIFILDGGDGDDYGMKRNLFSFCQKIIRFFRLYSVGKKYEKKCKFFRIFERIYFFSKWASLKDLRWSDFKMLFVVAE